MDNKTNPPPPAPSSLDTSADHQGNTITVNPEGKKRLLELQAELEKSEGSSRERIQEEIERVQKNVSTQS